MLLSFSTDIRLDLQPQIKELPRIDGTSASKGLRKQMKSYTKNALKNGYQNSGKRLERNQVAQRLGDSSGKDSTADSLLILDEGKRDLSWSVVSRLQTVESS